MKENCIEQEGKLAFSVNETVMVNDWSGIGWRAAVLIKNKPYHSRGRFISDGWEVRFTTNVAEEVGGRIPSQGGWVACNCIRKYTPSSPVGGPK